MASTIEQDQATKDDSLGCHARYNLMRADVPMGVRSGSGRSPVIVQGRGGSARISYTCCHPYADRLGQPGSRGTKGGVLSADTIRRL